MSICIYIPSRGEPRPNIVSTYFYFHFHFQVEIDNRCRGESIEFQRGVHLISISVHPSYTLFVFPFPGDTVHYCCILKIHRMPIVHRI